MKKNLNPNILFKLLNNFSPKENNRNSLDKESNKNDLYDNGLVEDYFYLRVKACDYRDKNNGFELLSYIDDEYSKDIDYPQDIHYSEDYSSQIDEDNYLINSLYFYRLITRYIDFGFTYSFLISYEDKPLSRGDIIFGSIIYSLPEISLKNARFIDDNKAINLKLNDLNRDFIFRLPKRYRDLDINNEDLEYYISYKMLLRYEILKLQ
jgi:hypothetical protein